MSLGFIPDRAIAAFTAVMPNSTAVFVLRPPWILPTGVRAAETMYTSDKGLYDAALLLNARHDLRSVMVWGRSSQFDI